MWAWVKLRSQAALVWTGRAGTGHPDMTEEAQARQLAAGGSVEETW